MDEAGAEDVAGAVVSMASTWNAGDLMARWPSRASAPFVPSVTTSSPSCSRRSARSAASGSARRVSADGTCSAKIGMVTAATSTASDR